MNRSRRAVLIACGAGLAPLAGCSSLDPGRETPTYEGSRLAALARKDAPRPPAAFPVSVPDAMVSRHLDRARELIEHVPERPDVPNADARERLGADRRAVLDRLDAADGDSAGRAHTPLRRLSAARAIREDAAAVDAAYRAATDDITEQTVADRRAQLRSAVVAFERAWTYRGDDPSTVVVVHRTLEDLRTEARPGIAPTRAFPEDPTTDPFRVGELVRQLERGDAALRDAGRLRARYRERLSEPRPYRTDFSVAASRLRRIVEQYREDLHGYIDADVEDLPFDRPIAETPLRWLYFWATDGLDIFRTDAEEARLRGDPATVTIARGVRLAVLRALDAIVTDIENERVTVPETVDGIEAARREAIGSLERAWSTDPTVLAVAVAHWSERLILDVTDRLRGPAIGADETPDTRDGYDIWATYVTAAHVAAAVPRTVADCQEALRVATS